MGTNRHIQSAMNQIDKALSGLEFYHPELFDKVDRELLRIKRSLRNIKNFVEKETAK